MGTQKKNVDLFRQINEGWLHVVGSDGTYNRDRLFKQIGVKPTAAGDYSVVRLTDSQRKQMKALIEKELGFKFPGGIEIDPAGNMNENEGFGKQAKKWGPIVGGAAAAAFGVPGLFPGLLSGGGGAAAGASGAAALPGASAAPSLATLLGPAPAAAGATGAVGTAGAIGGALKTADIARDVIKAAGSGMGDAADTMAGNRGVRMSAAAEAEALNVARRRDDRDSRADAWKAAQQAAYVGNRGSVAKGPGVAGPYSRNVNLPPIDPAIVAARRAEAAKRLQAPYQDFAFDPRDVNASGAEKALGIGSTVAGVASAVPESVWRKLGRLIFVALLVSSGLV